MHTRSRAGVMAVCLMAVMASAQSPYRLIIVVGRSDDPRVIQQHAALKHDVAALSERDALMQDITPEAARRERPELGVDAQAAFEVLLIGKDGEVKLRRAKPVAVSELTALIDTMPMRQREMRQ